LETADEDGHQAGGKRCEDGHGEQLEEQLVPQHRREAAAHGAECGAKQAGRRDW
jgi:hypothetical protein